MLFVLVAFIGVHVYELHVRCLIRSMDYLPLASTRVHQQLLYGFRVVLLCVLTVCVPCDVYKEWCPTHVVLCFVSFLLRVVYPILPVFAPSVLSSVYCLRVVYPAFVSFFLRVVYPILPVFALSVL